MLIASLLFGISASLDALLVGVCYGIKKIRIRLWQNLVISLVTLLGTCLSVGLGAGLAAFLPGFVGDYIGSMILLFLGFYYIAKWGFVYLRNRKEKTPPGSLREQEESKTPAGEVFPQLKPVEVFTLSLTLSLNNLSAGLSASLAGLTLFPAAVSTFACSVLFLSTGNRLGGNPLLQMTGRVADPLSGVLLMGLGIVQLFQ